MDHFLKSAGRVSDWLRNWLLCWRGGHAARFEISSTVLVDCTWHVTADFAAIRQLLRIGIPGGVDVLVLIACQLGFVSVINQLGDVAAGRAWDHNSDGKHQFLISCTFSNGCHDLGWTISRCW